MLTWNDGATHSVAYTRFLQNVWGVSKIKLNYVWIGQINLTSALCCSSHSSIARTLPVAKPMLVSAAP